MSPYELDQDRILEPKEELILLYLSMGDTPSQASTRSKATEFPFTETEADEIENEIKAGVLTTAICKIQEKISDDLIQYPLTRASSRIRSLSEMAENLKKRALTVKGRQGKPSNKEATLLVSEYRSVVEQIKKESQGAELLDIQGIVKQSNFPEKMDLLLRLVGEGVKAGFIKPERLIEVAQKHVSVN